MKKLVKESLLLNEDVNSSKIRILTIKDLKEVIENLSDDMDVMGYRAGQGDLYRIGYWIDEDPDVVPTFVISVD